MDDMQRLILRNATVELVKDMGLEDVLLQMTASQVFSDRDEDEIRSKKTRVQRCEELISRLPRRGAKAFGSFLEALEKNQPHLALVIVDASKWLCVTEGLHIHSGSEYRWILNEKRDTELPSIALNTVFTIFKARRNLSFAVDYLECYAAKTFF